MSDKYGYIGIETLLNYCQNSKDHSVTPNDFMRMNRVRIQEPKQGEWIPSSERLPEKDGKYLVTRTSYITRKPEVSISIFDSTTKEFYPEGIAWTTLPEPYKERR